MSHIEQGTRYGEENDTYQKFVDLLPIEALFIDLRVLFEATMAKIFTVLGDSNIKRHLNPINCRDRPMMSSAQQIPCQKLEIFAESLRSVREESNVCIVSCLSNFMCSSDESATISLRLAPIFSEVFDRLRAACTENVNRAYLVCPPTYRKFPLWYRDGLMGHYTIDPGIAMAQGSCSTSNKYDG